MAEVLTIAPRESPAKKQALEILDAMRKIIDDGEMCGLIVIAIGPGGRFQIDMTGDIGANQLLGVLDRAKFDILRAAERGDAIKAT